MTVYRGVRRYILPSIGVGIAGALWGLFWIPLRAIDDAGVGGGWGSLSFFIVCSLVLLPFALRRWRRLRMAGLGLVLTGMASGAGLALYATSLLFTDVVRSILLFYLTPVWSTILGRLLLAERVTLARATALVLGIIGLLVILGIDTGFPIPRNAGDWLALLSGLAWAYGSLRIYDEQTTGVFESVFVFFSCGMLVAIVVLLLPLEGNATLPEMSALAAAAPIIIGVALLFALPAIFVIVWGATELMPARVGLLLMGEVVVGVVSAALLTDEPYGTRELTGSLLIIGAALIEVLQRQTGGKNDEEFQSVAVGAGSDSKN